MTHQPLPPRAELDAAENVARKNPVARDPAIRMRARYGRKGQAVSLATVNACPPEAVIDDPPPARSVSQKRSVGATDINQQEDAL